MKVKVEVDGKIKEFEQHNRRTEIGYGLTYPRSKGDGIHFFFDCYENWSPGWRKNFTNWRLVKIDSLKRPYRFCGKCRKRIIDNNLQEYALKQSMQPDSLFSPEKAEKYRLATHFKNDTKEIFSLKNHEYEISGFEKHLTCKKCDTGEMLTVTYDTQFMQYNPEAPDPHAYFSISNFQLDENGVLGIGYMDRKSNGLFAMLSNFIEYKLSEDELNRYGKAIACLAKKLDRACIRQYGHPCKSRIYSDHKKIVQALEDFAQKLAAQNKK